MRYLQHEEFQILQMLSTGSTGSEITTQLGITKQGMRIFLDRVSALYDLTGRSNVIRHAIKRGDIPGPYIKRLRFQSLTPAEMEVALLIAKGLDNKMIADVLKITENAVKGRREMIARTLNTHGNLHLVVVLQQRFPNK